MMSKAQVESRLEAEQASMLERRRYTARHTEHRETPLPQGFAEQAVELENDETMVALEKKLDLELKMVGEALRRLKEGTYNICAVCGDVIDPQRLLALPSTTLCIGCAVTGTLEPLDSW